MLRNILVGFVALCAAASISANESDALTVERSVRSDVQLSFPNDRDIAPEPSAFELVNYVLMSNELGERFAVLTLTNSSTGNRVLEAKHLMALFADGTRQRPADIKLSFEGKETQSITVDFGLNKFPIMTIETRNEGA